MIAIGDMSSTARAWKYIHLYKTGRKEESIWFIAFSPVDLASSDQLSWLTILRRHF